MRQNELLKFLMQKLHIKYVDEIDSWWCVVKSSRTRKSFVQIIRDTFVRVMIFCCLSPKIRLRIELLEHMSRDSMFKFQRERRSF